MKLSNSLFAFFVTTLSLLLLAACGLQEQTHLRNETATVRGEMQEVYPELVEIYRYIWGDYDLDNPKTRYALVSLVDRIASQFHDVGRSAPALLNEPGFKASFIANVDLLKSIREEVKNGTTEYTKWRLTALTSNCVSCHTRIKAPVDFPGAFPEITDDSIESRIAAGEFLVATRQFEKGSQFLSELAQRFVVENVPPYNLLQALKLYLVVNIRVKQNYREASAFLAKFLSANSFALTDEIKTMLHSWISDLNRASANINQGKELLKTARDLVENDLKIEQEQFHNVALVRSLLATSYLHEFLSSPREKDLQREALLLLGKTYLLIPISIFDIYPELYFNILIRTYPGSEDAKVAYLLLEKRLKDKSTGTQGLHLEPEDVRKLRELRNLANRGK